MNSSNKQDYQYNQHLYYQDSNLQNQVLSILNPVINHGLREAQYTGYQHALTEAVAIAYLMGKGYDYYVAWQMVEAWWRPQGTPLPQMY